MRELLPKTDLLLQLPVVRSEPTAAAVAAEVVQSIETGFLSQTFVVFEPQEEFWQWLPGDERHPTSCQTEVLLVDSELCEELHSQVCFLPETPSKDVDETQPDIQVQRTLHSKPSQDELGPESG